jgi:FlaA1/EpsC-like NDP-sugar epimerase
MTTFEYLHQQTVLITGAAGTIGSALAQQILPHAKTVRCFDHAESELFFLHQRLSKVRPLSPLLGDIRDLDRLRFAMNGVDVVFHTAALKHVQLGEYNPFEVVQSNLGGLNNVIRASLDANVERVIFTSSDKAVNPTNVMGASKMMGERLMSAANEIRGTRRTRFGSVRFGNVIGSRGSVVPIFAAQLARGEPLTLTDESMTRYIMTVKEAAELVLEAGGQMQGGEVFVTKMSALKIVDLGYAMADLFGRPDLDWTRIGPRPGEKLYEELITADETHRTLELERLLVILPSLETQASASPKVRYPNGCSVKKTWNSSTDELMTRPEIANYLRRHRVLDDFRGIAEIVR